MHGRIGHGQRKRIVKYTYGIGEIDSVLAQVDDRLAFVLLVFHHEVYVQTYTK